MHTQRRQNAHDLRLSAFRTAIKDKQPISGYTHTFYRYPACFAPTFARSAIAAFSRCGDLVLDPFMGGGTTLVEAMALNRNAIGTDINSLAAFIASVKTTVLDSAETKLIQKWSGHLPESLNLRNKSVCHSKWRDAGYYRNLPWTMRKFAELFLEEVSCLKKESHQMYARCALLKLGQWCSIPVTLGVRAKSYAAGFNQFSKTSQME